MNSFVPTILVRSSLARTLATVFDAISKSCAVRVLVNNSIDVALQVSTNYASPLDELRPYKTLLLLYDADQIIASFPKDCSPLLPVLVRAVSPVDSFERIAAILDINLHMVYRLTSHLVYWKKARVIQSISNRNIYVASPNAQISKCVVLYSGFSELELTAQLNVVAALTLAFCLYFLRQYRSLAIFPTHL